MGFVNDPGQNSNKPPNDGETEMQEVAKETGLRRAQGTGNHFVDEAIQQIDAAIFSSDALDDINSALELQKYLHRWQRGLLVKFCPDDQIDNLDVSKF